MRKPGQWQADDSRPCMLCFRALRGCRRGHSLLGFEGADPSCMAAFAAWPIAEHLRPGFRRDEVQAFAGRMSCIN